MAAFPITSRRLTRNTETCLETYLIFPGIITAPFLKHIVFSQNILNIAAKIVILLLAFNCNLQADSLESLFFFLVCFTLLFKWWSTFVWGYIFLWSRFCSGKLAQYFHFSHLYIPGFLSAGVRVFDKEAHIIQILEGNRLLGPSRSLTRKTFPAPERMWKRHSGLSKLWSIFFRFLFKTEFCHLRVNFVLRSTFRFQFDWPGKDSVFLVSQDRGSPWTLPGAHNPGLSDYGCSVQRGKPRELSLFVLFVNGVFDIRRWHFALIIKYQNHWYCKPGAFQRHWLSNSYSDTSLLVPVPPSPENSLTELRTTPASNRAIALHNCWGNCSHSSLQK